MNLRHFTTPYIALLLCLCFYSGAKALPAAAHPGEFLAFAEQVESKTGYTLAYSPGDISLEDVSFPEDISGMTAEQALRKVLDEKQYELVFLNRHIVIRKKKEEPPVVEDMTLPSPQPEPYPKIVEPEEPSPVEGVEAMRSPDESEFSGGTRLIIIGGSPSQRQRTERASRQNPDSTSSAASRYSRDSIPLTSNENIGDKRIPFRVELMQNQAYKNPGDKKSRRKRRRG